MHDLQVREITGELGSVDLRLPHSCVRALPSCVRALTSWTGGGSYRRRWTLNNGKLLIEDALQSLTLGIIHGRVVGNPVRQNWFNTRIIGDVSRLIDLLLKIDDVRAQGKPARREGQHIMKDLIRIEGIRCLLLIVHLLQSLHDASLSFKVAHSCLKHDPFSCAVNLCILRIGEEEIDLRRVLIH